MVIVSIVNGDLLEAKQPYVGHQCNCNTINSRGLASSIAQKWPWADIYKDRKSRSPASRADQPGTVVVVDSHISDTPIILCLMGQWGPGKPSSKSRFYGNRSDTRSDRLKWFQQCLQAIDDDPEIDDIALPFEIGCGLAGGNWADYKLLLERCQTHITLYKKGASM